MNRWQLAGELERPRLRGTSFALELLICYQESVSETSNCTSAGCAAAAQFSLSFHSVAAATSVYFSIRNRPVGSRAVPFNMTRWPFRRSTAASPPCFVCVSASIYLCLGLCSGHQISEIFLYKNILINKWIVNYCSPVPRVSRVWPSVKEVCSVLRISTNL